MTYIIAEAGTNHYAIDPRARLQNAVNLVFRASMTGVDAVKFQMFVPDEPLFCPLEGDEKRWERWQYTYLSLDHWAFVKAKCKQYNVDFLASVFQNTAVEWIRDLQPKYYKVASRAAEMFPYDLLPGPFIVSCLRRPLVGHGRNYLYCVPEYPTPLSRARLSELTSGAVPRCAGLSDHSGTVWPGLDAIMHHARFLEVHFNLDGYDAGNDAPVCLTTDQLELLCEARDAVKQWQ